MAAFVVAFLSAAGVGGYLLDVERHLAGHNRPHHENRLASCPIRRAIDAVPFIPCPQPGNPRRQRKAVLRLDDEEGAVGPVPSTTSPVDRVRSKGDWARADDGASSARPKDRTATEWKAIVPPQSGAARVV